MFKRIYFANDHAGYELKMALLKMFDDVECIDLGSDNNRVDYPDFAAKLAQNLETDQEAAGVLICGSGLGISMAANRFAHVRAALCHCEEMAKLAREHNDANVIAFGARFVAAEHAASMLRVFLASEFAGGRHAQRVGKLSALSRS